MIPTSLSPGSSFSSERSCAVERSCTSQRGTVCPTLGSRLLLLPPFFNRAVTYKESRLQIIRRDRSNHPGTREKIWRQFRTLHPFGLDVEGSQPHKNDCSQKPAADEAKRSAEATIKPLNLRELDKPGSQPDDQQSYEERP